jgi:general secretion pathway protein D
MRRDKNYNSVVGRNAALIVALTGVLAGCATPLPTLPEPLDVSKPATPNTSVLIAGTDNKRNALTSSQGIAPPTGPMLAEPFSSTVPPKLTGENIGVDFEGIKLPAFVNTIFGELLKVTFEIDSAVMQREQLVTLSTAEPIPPDQFYRLVTDVLGNYGLNVVYQSGVYRIIEASTARQEIPRIIRSRALSSVPGDQRPTFFFTPVNNVQNTQMQIWLDMALKDRVRSTPVGTNNGLLLMGRREDIAAALETMEILDQPAMAGNHSLKISPAFWSALKLTEQLVTVLTAEGYSAGIGAQTVFAVRMIPIESLNTIIVFSTSETTLQHVLRWATELDQPSQTVNKQGIYYYQVQNASAKNLADLIGAILGDNPDPNMNVPAAQPGLGQAQAQQQQVVQPRTQGKLHLTVDESRNSIIFQGTAEEYAQFRTLVEQMDQAPLEVMIEATVAEVTLDQNESLGVVLGFDDGVASVGNRNTIRSSTGLIATLLRSKGQISASVDALAGNSRVTVLSTPRLVTTSGTSASIQVGSQVPIITTQQTAASGAVGGTSNILQDVQYRSTGILLTIKPVINSNRRVDLTISQEVSSASANNISEVDSPIIQQRSIQTNLTLTDGDTALLGGLISENYTDGDSGIPYLKSIPILGNLFKSQSKSMTRTELIILLTPYIIDSPETSHAVRDAFKARLGSWASQQVTKAVNPALVEDSADPMPTAVPQ